MKKAIVVIAVVMVLITAWVGFNPIGRFGFCRFGLLVYSAIPFPGVDLVIHANGLPAIRGSKAHFVGLAEIEPLLKEGPDVLIIGTGYDNMVQLEEEILAMSAVQILPLPTPQAVRRYNELKGEGKRVAAIVHSTC
ncbi:MAG: MTH938/NDUFAF3 family protein [Anaerolineae bacterium]